MSPKIKDPGTGNDFGNNPRRIVNADGTFNVVRKGARRGFKDFFTYLVEITWPKFFGYMFMSYLLLNILFSLLYFCMGPDQIEGINPDKNHFGQLLAFSIQTSTTVGYGAIYPTGAAAQFVSAISAFTGFLYFSLSTGILYGRFSKPNPKLLFSDNILYSKYKDGYSLKIRFANMRSTVLMDLQAELILVLDTEDEDGKIGKNYFRLELERNEILMLPLSWTVVHPIAENSPLFGLSKSEILALNPEVMVNIKAYNEVYGQQIRARHSYIGSDFEWNKSFQRIFHPEGDQIALDLDDLSLTIDE